MNNTANRILVTGGCRFIGVNLISQLLCTASNRARVIDNLSVGKKEDLEERQKTEDERQMSEVGSQ
jgi:UDP-glucose 4-epimerase